MTGQVQSTPAEHVSVGAPARQVRRMARAQAAMIGVVSKLLATMSHELRTPLNAILGFSRALLDGIDGDLNAAQRDDVLQIHDGGKGLLGVVNGVLDLARLESGAATFVEEEVVVETVVE